MASEPLTNEEAPVTMSSATQDSRLLALPPEIRNMIYEYASFDIPKALISIKPVQEGERNWGEAQLESASHPLLRTCRQIREEFKSVFSTANFNNAKELIWPVKNFHLYSDDYGRVYDDGICNFLDQLPALSGGSERTLTRRIFLDDRFDFRKHDCNIKVHCDITKRIGPYYEYRRADEAYPTGSIVYVEKLKAIPMRTTIHINDLAFDLRKLEGYLDSPYPTHNVLFPPMREALENANLKRAEMKFRRAKARARRAHRENEKVVEGGKVAPAMPAIQRVMRR